MGGSRIGFKIGYGTGGDEGPAVAGLNELFYKPKEYDILPYKHNHTADGEYVVTSYFIPAYSVVIVDGIIDKRGVCNKRKQLSTIIRKEKLKLGLQKVILHIVLNIVITQMRLFLGRVIISLIQ